MVKNEKKRDKRYDDKLLKEKVQHVIMNTFVRIKQHKEEKYIFISVLPDVWRVVRNVELGACVEVVVSSGDGRRYTLKTTPVHIDNSILCTMSQRTEAIYKHVECVFKHVLRLLCSCHICRVFFHFFPTFCF